MEPLNIQETVISELEEEKGNFLCGPEWKVKITTKAGQELDIKQVTVTSSNIQDKASIYR